MTDENKPRHVTGLTVGVNPSQKHIVLLLSTRREGAEHGLPEQFRCPLNETLATELVKQLSTALADIQDHPNPNIH